MDYFVGFFSDTQNIGIITVEISDMRHAHSTNKS